MCPLCPFSLSTPPDFLREGSLFLFLDSFSLQVLSPILVHIGIIFSRVISSSLPHLLLSTALWYKYTKVLIFTKYTNLGINNPSFPFFHNSAILPVLVQDCGLLDYSILLQNNTCFSWHIFLTSVFIFISLRHPLSPHSLTSLLFVWIQTHDFYDLYSTVCTPNEL